MKKIILVLLLLYSINSFSQEKEHWLGMGVFDAVNLKLQYERTQQLNNINIGLLFTNGSYDAIVKMPWMHYGPYVDIGMSWSQENSLMTNKIGYEFLALFVLARASVVNYTDFNNNQLCFRPEIGLCFSSLISITYGYNFGKKNPFGARGHVLSVNIAYPFPQW